MNVLKEEWHAGTTEPNPDTSNPIRRYRAGINVKAGPLNWHEDYIWCYGATVEEAVGRRDSILWLKARD